MTETRQPRKNTTVKTTKYLGEGMDGSEWSDTVEMALDQAVKEGRHVALKNNGRAEWFPANEVKSVLSAPGWSVA